MKLISVSCYLLLVIVPWNIIKAFSIETFQEPISQSGTQRSLTYKDMSAFIWFLMGLMLP